MIGCLLAQEGSDFVDTWLKYFEASARTKTLKDNEAKGEENEVMDIFIVTTGVEAVRKISIMAHHLKLEILSNYIKENVTKKIGWL